MTETTSWREYVMNNYTSQEYFDVPDNNNNNISQATEEPTNKSITSDN